MLFTAPDAKSWDTWLVEKDGLFHLFYIRIGPNAGRQGPTPSLGEGWDGISLATSIDLLHWKDHGPVVEKRPDAAWLGTGTVHKTAAGYIMNFSEERPKGQQVVCFAKSQDLFSWERLHESSDLRPDTTWYQRYPEESADPLPRWDSLGVIPPTRDHPQWLAVICANAVGTLPGECGTLGLLKSDDGMNWHAKPPIVAPGLFPSYEVPEHLEIDGRHYIMFSTNSVAGPRFDRRSTHPHSGTYYVVADNIEGPYRLPPGDPLLLGHRMHGPMVGTYVGRPILTSAGELLFYHQWTADYPVGWWGPPKCLVETASFELRLTYWRGCEALKSTLLVDSFGGGTNLLPTAGAVPVVEFSLENSVLCVVNRGGSGGVEVLQSATAAPGELSDGRIVEATLTVDSGRTIGIWIGHLEDTALTTIALNHEYGVVELGTTVYDKDGASMRFEVTEAIPWPLRRGVAQSVRLMYRAQFVDVYVGDLLVTSLVATQRLDPNRMGVYAELASGDVSQLTVWAMG